MATNNEKKPIVRNGKIKTKDMKFARPVHAITVVKEPETKWGQFLHWLKVKLQFRDGWWSIPLFSLIFFGSGLVGHYVFGYQWMFYDPMFLQPAFGAVGVLLILLNGVIFIMWFYFRYVHRFIYGKHLPDEKIIVNYSKDDWRNLQPCQRIKYSLFIMFFLLFLAVVVYIVMK